MKRLKYCVAFRGNCQDLCELLESSNYEYSQAKECLPRDFQGDVLFITFFGNTYTILPEFPDAEYLDDIFINRKIPDNREHFKNLINGIYFFDELYDGDAFVVINSPNNPKIKYKDKIINIRTGEIYSNVEYRRKEFLFNYIRIFDVAKILHRDPKELELHIKSLINKVK